MSGGRFENITITMTKKEKKALKRAALNNDVSESELIRQRLTACANNLKATKTTTALGNGKTNA